MDLHSFFFGPVKLGQSGDGVKQEVIVNLHTYPSLAQIFPFNAKLKTLRFQTETANASDSSLSQPRHTAHHVPSDPFSTGQIALPRKTHAVPRTMASNPELSNVCSRPDSVPRAMPKRHFPLRMSRAPPRWSYLPVYINELQMRPQKGHISDEPTAIVDLSLLSHDYS